MIASHTPRRTVRTSIASACLLGLVLAGTGCSQGSEEDERAGAAALVEQGIAQLQSGENDEAEETLARALRLDPEQALAHYNLGVIDQRANRAEKALEHYEDALDLAPDHGPSLYNSALLTERTDLDEAITIHRAAIKAQPKFAPGHMRLGFALHHLGRTDEAAPFLAKGIELDPAMESVAAPSYE